MGAADPLVDDPALSKHGSVLKTCIPYLVFLKLDYCSGFVRKHFQPVDIMLSFELDSTPFSLEKKHSRVKMSVSSLDVC
jgi:hypothetical protein